MSNFNPRQNQNRQNQNRPPQQQQRPPQQRAQGTPSWYRPEVIEKLGGQGQVRFNTALNQYRTLTARLETAKQEGGRGPQIERIRGKIDALNHQQTRALRGARQTAAQRKQNRLESQYLASIGELSGLQNEAFLEQQSANDQQYAVLMEMYASQNEMLAEVQRTMKEAEALEAARTQREQQLAAYSASQNALNAGLLQTNVSNRAATARQSRANASVRTGILY